MAFLSAKVIIRSVDKCLKLHFQKQPLNWTICCFLWELIPFCNCPCVEGILVVIPDGFRLFHENSESQTSFVAIPNVIFFPYSQPCLSFAESGFACSSQIPYPVSVSRLPHCILVKSRIPSTFSRIPHCLLVKSRIPGYPLA